MLLNTIKKAKTIIVRSKEGKKNCFVLIAETRWLTVINSVRETDSGNLSDHNVYDGLGLRQPECLYSSISPEGSVHYR